MPLVLATKSKSPPSPQVNSDAVRHGKFVRVVYDGLNEDTTSEFYCYPLYPKSELFSSTGFVDAVGKYTIPHYIYSTEELIFPFNLLHATKGSAWMGYIATSNAKDSNDSYEIIVAIRGSVSKLEWVKDVGAFHAAFTSEDSQGAPVSLGNVHEGFLSLYTKSDSSLVFGKYSLQDQIHKALLQLICTTFNGDKVRVAFVGHSLGCAIATLAACDMATFISTSQYSSNVTVSLTTFGSPRVGDQTFKGMAEKNITGGIWRYVDNGDPVPMLPPPMFLNIWEYSEVGETLKVDPTSAKKYLKSTQDCTAFHNLDLYLFCVASNAVSSTSQVQPRGIRNILVDVKLIEMMAEYLQSAPYLEILNIAYAGNAAQRQNELLNYLNELSDVFKALNSDGDTVLSNVPPSKRPKLTIPVDSDEPQYCLINRSTDLLKAEYAIPPNWGVPPYKDMKVVDGKWLNRRQRGDVPTPHNGDYN